jgi:hypothetical protein
MSFIEEEPTSKARKRLTQVSTTGAMSSRTTEQRDKVPAEVRGS